MRKRNIFFLVLTIVGAVIFASLVHRLGWDKIKDVFLIFSWWQFALLIGLYFLSIIFMALSMQVILKALGHPLPFRVMFPMTAINLAVGFLTPLAYLGGEPVQVYLMYKRYHVPVAVSTTNVLLEKIGRQTITMVFIGIGIAWLVFNPALSLYYRLGLLALIIFLVFILWAYFAKSISGEGFLQYMIRLFRLKKLKVLSRPRVAREIANIDQCTSEFLTHHRRVFGVSLIYATLAELIPMVQMGLALAFLGYAPSIVSILLLFMLTNLLTLLPTPAQLGTYEASGISVFAIRGAAGAGLIFSVFMHVVNVISVLPGLLLVPIYGMTIREAMFNGKDLQQRLNTFAAKNGMVKQVSGGKIPNYK